MYYDFPIKVDPLNLEFFNQLRRTFLWFQGIPPIKISDKSVKGSLVSIGHTFRQTEITTKAIRSYIFIYIFCILIYVSEWAEHF